MHQAIATTRPERSSPSRRSWLKDVLAAMRPALLGATALTSAAALTPATAQAPAQKPNILFIMGDDIGWMQPSIYHQGYRRRRNAEHRSHRPGRCEVHDVLRRAELHGRSQCVLYRDASSADRHDPATASRAAHPILRPGTPPSPSSWAISATPLRRIRQEPSRRSHRCAADGARFSGVLGLPLSPRRDAGRQLPRHQQDADPAGSVAPVCRNTPIPGSGPGSRRSRSRRLRA